MKRLFGITIIALCLIIGGLAEAAETLIASGHPQYPPIMWKEGKSIVGVGPELAAMLFKDLQVTVRSPYVGTWDKVQDQAKQGKVDVLVGLYMTEERKSFFEYSHPYTKDPVVIFVAKGKAFPYAKWDDLIGKKGISTVGDSFGQEFDKVIAEKLTVARSTDVEGCFAKLFDGTADYFIYAKYSGIFKSEKLGLADRMEYLPVNACVEDFHIGIAKKSPYAKYLPEINKRLDELVKDGTVERLVQQYTERYRQSMAAEKEKVSAGKPK
jgi:polar amino acid transport system substrate-binding protein